MLFTHRPSLEFAVLAFAFMLSSWPTQHALGNDGTGLPTVELGRDTVELTVRLRDGSVLNVGAEDAVLQWKTVARDGTISLREIQLSELQKLSMARNPASRQVAEVRRLVSELASDSYTERHRAEKRLISEGKPFSAVITQAKDHKEPEVRYRVARILKRLEKVKASNTNKVTLEFDNLTLVDRQALEGDMDDWTLECQWMDQSLKLDRQSIVSIERPPVAALVPPNPSNETAQIHSLIRDNLFFEEDGTPKPGIIQSAFEKGANDEDMVNDKSVAIDRYFGFLGCLLACETHQGRVIITGFRFKQSRSSNNSIGNFFVHPETGKDVRYQGTTRVEFCLPGYPDIPATVHQVGMFLEIVLPKHTILEACNSAGHLIGVTQTGRERSSFVGFDSNIPIAYVRVLANEHYDVEKLNRDFAVDDLCFSQPVVAHEINRSDSYVIVTKDYQRILANAIELTESHVFLRELTTNIEELKIPLDQVQWIVGPKKDESDSIDGGYFVMTGDGSVVHCSADLQMQMSAQREITVGESEIAGIWDVDSPARYPSAGDFDHGKVVVVRPLNRVALKNSALNLSDKALTVDLAGAVNLEQPMFDDDKPMLIRDAVAGDLGLTEGDDSMLLSQDQSIWFQAPGPRAAGTGVLMTYDGQQFVLGGQFGFSLDKTSQDSVVLSKDNKTISFALGELMAIQLPGSK